MVAPATARVPGFDPTVVTLAVLGVLLAACLIHDFRESGRLHPLNLWGSAAILASVPARIALAQTAGWHSIAEWMTR